MVIINGNPIFAKYGRNVPARIITIFSWSLKKQVSCLPDFTVFLQLSRHLGKWGWKMCSDNSIFRIIEYVNYQKRKVIFWRKFNILSNIFKLFFFFFFKALSNLFSMKIEMPQFLSIHGWLSVLLLLTPEAGYKDVFLSVVSDWKCNKHLLNIAIALVLLNFNMGGVIIYHLISP